MRCCEQKQVTFSPWRARVMILLDNEIRICKKNCAIHFPKFKTGPLILNKSISPVWREANKRPGQEHDFFAREESFLGTRFRDLLTTEGREQ